MSIENFIWKNEKAEEKADASARRLKILMLVPHAGIQGGIPRLAPLLAKSLRELGCEVITAPWGRHTDNESWSEKFQGRVKDLFKIWKIQRRRGGFDVMVIHTAHTWPALCRDIPLLLITPRKRIASALLFHGSQPEKLFKNSSKLFKFLSTRLVRMCSAILVLSSPEKNLWGRVCPESKIFVVKNPNVADTVLTKPSDELKLKLPDNVPVLLFAGRLVEEKGIFDLLNALSLIKGKTPFHLIIAGDGREAERVAEKIVSASLSDCVTQTGYLDGKQLAEAYRLSNVFVLPTYWNEGFPAVIMEAMTVGLPIITTCHRGVADHLQEGVHSLFVPPRNPVALAESLRLLLGEAELRARMGEANKQKVNDFAPDEVGKLYFETLKKVIAGINE